MKRKILSLMLVLTSTMSLATQQAFAKKPINIVVGGELLETDVNPVIVDGRTLVPLRAIFEALDAEVAWNAAEQTVTATKGDKVISLKIGSKDLKVNSEIKKLDVPAQIVDGRTMIPVRAISEALDAEVSWNEKSETVRIKTEVWLPSKIEVCSVWAGDNPTKEYEWYEYTYNLDGSQREDCYVNDKTGVKENAEHSYTISEVDVDGNIVRESFYHQEGESPEITEIKYNERGLLTEDYEYTYEYDQNDNLIKQEKDDEVTVYTYDSQNRMKKKVYTSDSAYYRVIDEEYKYDANDNIVKIIGKYSYYFGDGLKTDERITEYKYDDFGRVIELVDPVNGKTKYKYTADGKVQFEEYDWGIYEYKYFQDTVLRFLKAPDSDEYSLVGIMEGPLASGVDYPADGVEYSIDDKGRLYYISMYNGDSWYKIKYDENGNIVSVEDSDGSYAKTEYVKVKM